MDLGAAASPLESCRHCGGALGWSRGGSRASRASQFCCRGCEEVFRLIHEAGLDRYYDLGGGDGHPVLRASADHKWLENILTRRGAGDEGRRPSELTRLTLDAQGVHCSGCVWLLEKLFRKHAQASAIVVNPALGSVDLTFGPAFPLERWVEDVEAFGYRLGPALKQESKAHGDLVWRMGVCVAIAMNTMIFGFAIYCGLADGPVLRLFHALDFGLSLISVAVGGSVFFRSAWRSLARGVLHLDVPIALGVALAFASSTYTYGVRGGATSYFDTLTVFIALMLVGRFLQERVLSRNRTMLLASDGAEGLYARKVSTEGVPSLVRCTEICAGDVLLVGHADVVPVDAVVMARPGERADAPASFSLDWISGESAPRSFGVGATVPAGAFFQGPEAVRLRATTAFQGSQLVSLLRSSTRRDADAARATSWHERLSKIYVTAVLGVASAAFVGWLVATRDVARTLDVVAALLIVTCPCAFGIATPLAYELVQARLRRAGLFIRTPGFLDRATEVTDVVFDKTGTLTTGHLVVVESRRALARLSSAEIATLFAMVVRSSHPKSRALTSAIEAVTSPAARALDPSLGVHEVTGRGLELRESGHLFRVGARGWAVAPASLPTIARPARGDVVFTRDGVILAAFETSEELRSDAAEEVEALQRAGYETYVLSGDEPSATRRMARACGIADDHTVAEHTPEEKASWLQALSSKRREGAPKVLFVGDGINDSLVAEAAHCAGTPAIDRPFMASRCDFYFVAPGLRPIRHALSMARRLAQVVRRNLVIALLYNVCTVTLAVAGLMNPLLCAIVMPISSLSTVLATTAQLSLSRESRNGRRWRS